MSQSSERTNQEELTLSLTTSEVNLILEAIGALPYVKVFMLVAKVQEQARRQLEARSQEAADGA